MIRFACPRCRAVLEQPDSGGGTKMTCPSCGQRLQVPASAENKTVLGDLMPGTPPASAQMPPPPLPPLPYVTSNPEPAAAPPRRQADNPPPVPSPPRPAAPRARRWDRNDDDDYDDDDYPTIERRGQRRGRYSKEVAARAASSGLICSLISMGLLLLTFILWVLMAQNRRGRFGEGEPLLVVLFLVILGSFILSLLGIVFSSRGLDESNTHNRGQATAGLVVGIISLVIGSIVGLFVMCFGLLFFSGRGW